MSTLTSAIDTVVRRITTDAETYAQLAGQERAASEIIAKLGGKAMHVNPSGNEFGPFSSDLRAEQATEWWGCAYGAAETLRHVTDTTTEAGQALHDRLRAIQAEAYAAYKAAGGEGDGSSWKAAE